jgi:hypothetical protein
MSLQAAIPHDRSDLLPHNNSISAAHITTLAQFLTSDQKKKLKQSNNDSKSS